MARSRYKRECLEYVSVDYVKKVSFPKDMVFCDLCPFCLMENRGTRFRCAESGEILPFHNDDIGRYCPLGIKQEIKEESEEN